MKLLDEIIDLLSNDAGSLNEALLKTKVLLHKIGQQSLIGWVNDELTGYAENNQIPDYRIVQARVCGNISNGQYSYTNTAIPILHLTDQQKDDLRCVFMSQALGVLESMAHSGNELAIPHPPEIYQYLTKSLAKTYYIQSAWTQIESSQVQQILITVRSRLLDFILELQGKIGETMSDNEAKAATESIDVKEMLQGAIFGDNTTILLGSHNNQHVKIIQTKGDTHALAAELRKHGVEDTDIATLGEAIKADSGTVEVAEKKFGPAVKAWLQTMMGKAIDASWNIELGVAGGVLTNALQNYYG